MISVFDVIRISRIDHAVVNSHQLVITDINGKPNGLLTDLLRDVIEKMNIFMNITLSTTVDDVLVALSKNTPLPEDALSEYEKVLTENVTHLNIGTRKKVIELVLDR
ncbi:hypothetical protein [Pediococcus damnosus]|uniref:hypothetical protein n=1 Tax=Pediococcus damnosus TaxID=51663 RepID=UPI000704FD90|nr:hypothetical protein [Pediococcus damnosus]PJE49114.1 hypothetical protein BSQ36_03795 [Pediococcus damnosus]